MSALFLSPPSFDGFDGGAGARYQARREVTSFWYPTWLAQPAALVPNSRLLDCPPHDIGMQETLRIAKDFGHVIINTSTPSLKNDCKVAEAIKAQRPDAAIITFPRGIGMSLPQVFTIPTIDGVSIDSETPLWVNSNGLCLQGNIPPAALIAGGKTLEVAVRDAKTAMQGKPWIANLGHGILPQTPPEHVTDFVRLVRADA
jgi:hypothetical protein